jgi:hypothetical protein
MYSPAERVFVLERYFALTSCAADREAFSSLYPDKEVPNKTTIHRLVTKFRDTGGICLWQVLIEQQSSRNYGRADFKQCISCNNGIRLQEFNTAVGLIVLCVKEFVRGFLILNTRCLRTKINFCRQQIYSQRVQYFLRWIAPRGRRSNGISVICVHFVCFV